MKSRKIIGVGFLLLTLAIPNVGAAEQFVTVFNGREVVVHTNRIPVVMHRLVPPQHGRHITTRELASQKEISPTPLRFFSR